MAKASKEANERPHGAKPHLAKPQQRKERGQTIRLHRRTPPETTKGHIV